MMNNFITSRKLRYIDNALKLELFKMIEKDRCEFNTSKLYETFHFKDTFLIQLTSKESEKNYELHVVKFKIILFHIFQKYFTYNIECYSLV